MVKEYQFDPETGSFILTSTAVQAEKDTGDEEPFVVVDNVDDLDVLPGGTAPGKVYPPESFYVLTQTVRLLPGGGTAVDVLIQVDDNADTNEYEVRLSK